MMIAIYIHTFHSREVWVGSHLMHAVDTRGENWGKKMDRQFENLIVCVLKTLENQEGNSQHINTFFFNHILNINSINR